MIERDPFEALLTAQDPQMLRTIERARRVADVDVALLIQGEPGTGKLILARTIHEASKRRDGPFLTLDLATIAPGQVVEALYGTEDGQNQGPGLLAKAADGTLVLDSIGELPADAQRALLGELGADEHCHARIMGLTHHNLVDDVRAGRFDLDLYYALAVGVLRIPALRDRPDDILLMTDHFFKQRGDATGSARGEHALEVQLPFLQVVLGKFKLIAIVMGEQEEDTARALGQALGAALSGTNTLIVAASNLSHFHSQKEAKAMDSLLQSAVQKFDPQALMETIESGKAEASGAGAIAAALHAAKQLGGKDIRFLGYGNSGETTGQVDEVVGYMSAAILSSAMPGSFGPVKSIRKNSPTKEEELELIEKNKEKLKEIAVSSIEAGLRNEDYSPAVISDLKFQRGVYVTISIDGEPKGTAGRIKIREPLYQAVAMMAKAAATQGKESHDLLESEADSIEVKLAILSRIELVNNFGTIDIDNHGLMIKLDMHSAIIFPSELSGKNWNKEKFLEQLCLKAGLPKKSYKEKFAEIFKFTAQEF